VIAEPLSQLAKAAGGKLLRGRPDTLVRGHYSDTRTPVQGALFVALRGENFDGNSFAREAITKFGAAAVLLDCAEAARALPENAGAILVNDTREGYLGIAAAHRTKMNAKLWFGVTGSVGKSTTKEMLAHVLQNAVHLNVHKAKGSFNNAVGLSHTVLGLSDEHDAAVLELGTNHPGEIRQLAQVARPNIAIITCAAEAHLETFKTVENVAREKADVFFHQSESDAAILNADSPYLALWRGLTKGKVLTYGQAEDADVRAKYIRIDEHGCAEFMVRCADAIADCHLRVPGLHQVSNALAVIAACLAAGIPFTTAVRGLATFDGIARRFTVRYVRGFTLIDDAYNANPASFSAALETLKSMQASRRFVVAGDMLELGGDSAAYHLKLGQSLASCGLAGLFTVGDAASLAGASAVGHGMRKSQWIPCATPEEAAEALKPRLQPGDVILVKGSHSIHLEKCCAILEAR